MYIAMWEEVKGYEVGAEYYWTGCQGAFGEAYKRYLEGWVIRWCIWMNVERFGWKTIEKEVTVDWTLVEERSSLIILLRSNYWWCAWTAMRWTRWS